MKADSLGDRMKVYEGIPRAQLMPRVPVIIRVDGKAFHTLTRDMDKPVDIRMRNAMVNTAQFMAENIQGCQLAYVQSDEISLLLTDYSSREAQGWFEYDHQKMVSVSASFASVAFAKAFWKAFPDRSETMMAFDSRAWSLPQHEVVNYFIWRQQDAVRNSVQSLARAHFSHRRLNGISNSQAQEMLFQEKGINWNDCPISQKRGVCIVRKRFHSITPDGKTFVRNKWAPDWDIPTFTEDRNYIQCLVDPPTAESEASAA